VMPNQEINDRAFARVAKPQVYDEDGLSLRQVTAFAGGLSVRLDRRR
jgi:hypothetical protein